MPHLSPLASRRLFSLGSSYVIVVMLAGLVMALVAATPALAAAPVPVTYSNAGAITINDQVAATPYPSTINVAGFSGKTSKITVTLNGLTHTFLEDIDIIVVGPGGQKAWVISDVGGNTGGTNLNLTLDDDAAAYLPNNTITSGTYKPTNLIGFGDDVFPGSAPAAPYDATFAAFKNIDPNGTWQLFVRDDGMTDTGTIAGGWTLTVYPADATKLAVAGYTSPTAAGTAHNFTVTAQDASNATAPGYNGTVHFTSSDPKATLPTDYTFVAGDNGVRTFSATLGTVGLQSITATDTATATVTGSQTNIQVIAGPPTQLSVSGGNNQAALLNTAFTDPLEVLVTDAYDNPVSGATVSYMAPPTGASATLTVPTPTNAAGKTSVNATANGIAGSYGVLVNFSKPLSASPKAVGGAVFNLSNVEGNPVTLEIVSGTPQSAITGQNFAQPLVVKVTDVDHLPVEGAQIVFSAPGTGASATLTKPALTDANGETQVTATANNVIGSYEVIASTDMRTHTPKAALPQVAFKLTNTSPPSRDTADLAVSLSAANSHPSLNQPLTFKATVTNNGPAAATGVKVKLTLPDQLQYISSSAPTGTSYDPGTGIWTIGDLASGASLSLTITAQVTANGQFTIKAAIGEADQTDPNLDNNSALLVLSTELPKLPAELSAQLLVTPDHELPATAGSQMVMNFTVRNVGPGKARYVVAKVPFDQFLQPVASSIPNSSDWVAKIVTEEGHSYLEINFHDLDMLQQSTATITFEVKAGATPGAMLNLRFTTYWDDDTAVGRSRESNLVQVTFGAATQNENSGKVRHFDPAQVTTNQGQHVTLTGDFFSPNEKVEFWSTQDGKSVSLGYAWADARGKVTFDFNTANLPAGVYSISGSGYFSQAQGTSTLTVKGGPQNLTPATTSLKVGQSVKLSGNFFAPGEKVTYWYTVEGKSVPLGYAWATGNGEVNLTFDATGLTPGQYTFVATGNQTGITGQAALTVVAA